MEERVSADQNDERIQRVDSVPETVLPSHYIGIGASAGGLEAIESFFSAMTATSGLAFIVIQHLSPDFKSLMVELLSKKTLMPVHRAEDGMPVLANHVYLIPPKKTLTIFQGKLLLNDQDHSKGINLPIDIFLRSLAEDQGEKAVGVILSGTGSDGTRGVRVVKELGGMVMVQDEESAKFDGMPRAAIATGLADFILSPGKMPVQLLAYVKHPYVVKSERSETLLNDEDGLTRIFSMLRERCKVDFTYYKPSTVTRRLERRMSVNQVDGIKEYVDFLKNYPGEVDSLYRELLIGVTSFFRDQATFDYLAEQVLPEIFSAPNRREARFWVAACSTGEEAYSLAILIRECLEQLEISWDVKIFATDIDREAIHFAATGSYPESIAADISPRLLAKYFYKRDENFQITRTIREMVVFAQHNLLRDPPFTNIDMISCRNLLIYFQVILQHKVFDFFNFSLRPGGSLFLGTSETVGDMGDYFETVEPKLKFYRSRGRSRHIPDAAHLLAVTDTRMRDAKGQFGRPHRAQRSTEEDRILERFLTMVTGDYLPLTLIVNDHLELLQIVGDVEGYFKLPTGKVVNDISKMAAKELAIPLVTGIQKVLRSQQELRFSNIRLTGVNGVSYVNLRIKPFPRKKEQDILTAIFIEPVKRTEPADSGQPVLTYDLTKEAEERMRDLEHELQFTRENLQATIEELETSNEELQATNEELLASNEELQSTNEELQSTNEELFTVNAEYQGKVIELTELHNDVENLLSATQVGNLLLDENLEVRRFSKKITDIFKILDSDIGRPLTHIPHYLKLVDPLETVREVHAHNRTVEREVQTEDNRWYLMRVVPYKIGPRTFSGAVLSFVEISAMRATEERLRDSNHSAQMTIDSISSNICVLDEKGIIISVNKSWREFLAANEGLTISAMEGTNYLSVCENVEGPEQGTAREFLSGIRDVMKGLHEQFEMEYPCDSVSEQRWFMGRVTPFIGSGAKSRGVVIVHEDTTSRKLASIALLESEERFRRLCATGHKE